jgi:hypothetical protein
MISINLTEADFCVLLRGTFRYNHRSSVFIELRMLFGRRTINGNSGTVLTRM